MAKKVIAFDLDGTLAPSKSNLPDRMAMAFRELLSDYQMCVISGGKFAQFEKQLLSNLHATADELKHLHLMPTCGTQYYRYDDVKKSWQRVYAELIDEPDKKRIVAALNKGFDDLGYRAKKVYGPVIEDRESQITFSVLGQDVVDVLGEKGVELKYAWDPDDKKKQAVRDYIAPLIPDFEVRVGGVTSIDVTRPGIDKAYGMQKLMEILGVAKKDILFFGDRIREGGNDYPVKQFGIDSLEVSRWEDTALALEAIAHAR